MAQFPGHRPTDPSRAWPPMPEADALAVAIDLCPHRRSCQCRPPIECDKSGATVLVTLEDCRRCLQRSPA